VGRVVKNVERKQGAAAHFMRWSDKVLKGMAIDGKCLSAQEVKVGFRVWIISMSEKSEIEKWVIDQFSELENYKFSKPVVKRDGWTTSVDWLGSDIAIELELDWREFDAFIFIVRLEDGQLPQGYYVSNGKPCRFHLQEVVKERGWPVAQDEMMVISPNGRRGRSSKPSDDSLRKRLLAYKGVLLSCVDQVVADGASIFSA
jgi:hypothetical protein